MRFFRRKVTSARPVLLVKACGHRRHVGCCAFCQQFQLERWAKQLRDVSK